MAINKTEKELIEEKAKSLLTKKLEEIQEDMSSQDLTLWQKSVLKYIETFFGINSSFYKDFSEIKFFSSIYISGADNKSWDEEARKSGLKESQKMINDFIDHIENVGLKIDKANIMQEKNLDIILNVNQNQQQSQEQILSIDFIVNEIKDSLDTETLTYLKNILSDYKVGKESRGSIMKFIKSLGQGVAENLIANIILNPTILTSLIK